MAGLRPQELIIILVIILVLFGGKNLPSMARSIGRAQHEFEKGLEDSEPPHKAGEKIAD